MKFLKILKISDIFQNFWNFYSLPALLYIKLFTGEKTTAPGVNGMYTIGKSLGFVLPNIYYLKEDTNIKWMAYEYWNFTSSFLGMFTCFSLFLSDYIIYFSESDLSQYNNVKLVLDGIDTFAVIKLNNHTISTTENMFRQYVLDIQKYLVVSIYFLYPTIWGCSLYIFAYHLFLLALCGRQPFIRGTRGGLLYI